MEISRLLRFPFANNIEYFARGQVEMVEFRAPVSYTHLSRGTYRNKVFLP